MVCTVGHFQKYCLRHSTMSLFTCTGPYAPCVAHTSTHYVIVEIVNKGAKIFFIFGPWTAEYTFLSSVLVRNEFGCHSHVGIIACYHHHGASDDDLKEVDDIMGLPINLSGECHRISHKCVWPAYSTEFARTSFGNFSRLFLLRTCCNQWRLHLDFLSFG